MAKRLFGGALNAKLLDDAFRAARGTDTGTLIKPTTTGSLSANDVDGPVAGTPTSHTFRGFMSQYKDSEIDGTIIRRGMRKVLIFGNSIKPAAVPVPQDQIEIEGQTFTIVDDGVKRDPAEATFICTVE